jgi:hypothetical protein
MYLKKIAVENAGPISNLRVDLPFHDGVPLPLVLVGPNGSGKSILLSFIVNALVGFKQQAFERAEVEQSRVYRVRSRMFIRYGTSWYHAKLEFEEGLSLEEWVLDRPRKAFEAEVSPLPANPAWRQMADDESDCIVLTPQPQNPAFRALSKPIQKLFRENIVLFFPSDRFELPDWLNEQSLAAELRFPEPITFQGQTARRIFSRALLRPTLEWLKAVTLDSRLSDYQPIPIPVVADNRLITVQGLLPRTGRDSKVIEFVGKVLARILDADSDAVGFQFSHRNAGTIAALFQRSGRQEVIPNLLGLSAGQAALFCVFSNMIRDFDLAGAPLNEIADIRGIVILDEADLHLHVDLQYRILPQLIKAFPKVQFILTAHSPLLVMGMEQAFGEDGFRCIDMPSGGQIATESFSEFGQALSAFCRTQAFDRRILAQIQQAAKPVIIVEGKTDVTHLRVAWEKLYSGKAMPWDIVSCGGYSPKESQGGAKMLRTLLHACCLHLERTALGLFDYDREGADQFNSLKSDGFAEATAPAHLKHSRQPVHALLLPVPPSREKFVAAGAKSCFVAIEHYYSDAVLTRFGVADDPVVSDSAVFAITADATKKARFADALPSLDMAEFANFNLLFDRLSQLLAIQPEETPAPVRPTRAADSQAVGITEAAMKVPAETQTAALMVPATTPESTDLPTAPELVRSDVQGQGETTEKRD